MTPKKLQNLFASKTITELREWARSQGILKLTYQGIWDYYFTPPKCAHCKKPTLWGVEIRAYREFCSKSCVAASKEVVRRRRATNLKRYGVEEANLAPCIKEKKRQHFLAVYGVDNPSKDAIVQAKKEKTSLKNFGTTHWAKAYENHFDSDNPMQYQVTRDKIKETNLARYGTDNPAKSARIQRRMRRVFLEKYGVDNPSKHPDVIARITKSTHAIIHDPLRRKKFVQAVMEGLRNSATNDYRCYTVTGKCQEKHVVQGYERYVVPILASLPKVRKIVTDKVPYITYSKRRTYVPDMMVILTNGERRIIEVKSKYTLLSGIDINCQKFQAAEKYCKSRPNTTFWLALVSDTSDHSIRWIKRPVVYAERVRDAQLDAVPGPNRR